MTEDLTPVVLVVAALSLTQTQGDKYCCDTALLLSICSVLATHFHMFSVLSLSAMSSYLYIVKSELPLVIQAFLKADPSSEWVLSFMFIIYLFIHIINISVLLVNGRESDLLLFQTIDTVCRVKGPVKDLGQWIISLHYSLIQCGDVMKLEACNWLSNASGMVWYVSYVYTQHKPSLLSAVQASCIHFRVMP